MKLLQPYASPLRLHLCTDGVGDSNFISYSKEVVNRREWLWGGTPDEVLANVKNSVGSNLFHPWSDLRNIIPDLYVNPVNAIVKQILKEGCYAEDSN